jgi:hypothetical protein
MPHGQASASTALGPRAARTQMLGHQSVSAQGDVRNGGSGTPVAAHETSMPSTAPASTKDSMIDGTQPRWPTVCAFAQIAPCARAGGLDRIEAGPGSEQRFTTDIARLPLHGFSPDIDPIEMGSSGPLRSVPTALSMRHGSRGSAMSTSPSTTARPPTRSTSTFRAASARSGCWADPRRQRAPLRASRRSASPRALRSANHAVNRSRPINPSATY